MLCNKIFSSERLLRDHGRRHSKSVCSMTPRLIVMTTRRPKMESVFGYCILRFLSVNHYKCPFCELSLPTPSTLRWHVMHRHTETTPHVCLTCSKGQASLGFLYQFLISFLLPNPPLFADSRQRWIWSDISLSIPTRPNTNAVYVGGSSNGYNRCKLMNVNIT